VRWARCDHNEWVFSRDEKLAMKSVRAVGQSHRENEFASIAAELDRYWLEQLRRAGEICDLLERQFSAVSRPHLRLVGSAPPSAEPTHSEGKPPQ
jgi:hypothetical protein